MANEHAPHASSSSPSSPSPALPMAAVLVPSVRAQSSLKPPLSPVSKNDKSPASPFDGTADSMTESRTASFMVNRSVDPRRAQSATELHRERSASANDSKPPTMLAAMGRSSSNFLAMSSQFFMGALGKDDEDDRSPVVPVNVVYETPGSLYMDLFSRPDGKGAYVKSFRRQPDGSMGIAEANGRIRVNDELYAINGLVVTEFLFSSIIQAAKTATFPLTLTFHCRALPEQQQQPQQKRKNSLPPASPAKGSTFTNGTSWTNKIGQMMVESGMKRSTSTEKKLDQSSGSTTSPVHASSTGDSTPSGLTTPGKLKQVWGESSIALDKMKNSGTDGMKNLLRMIGGKARPEEDLDTVNMWLEQLLLRPDISHADDSNGTVNSLYHSTPIVAVTAGGRLIGVKDEDATEFAVSWYRKMADDDLIHIKGAKSGRYFPSVDDVGTKLSAHVQSLRFTQLSKVVEFPRQLTIDPAVGELVDILLEAGAGSFSATLASNEFDSFQVKISSERVALVKISEDENEAGVVVDAAYDAHLQVLLDPTNQLRFTLKARELGGFLGNRHGDTCSMKKKSQFNELSCFFLVAQNPQHRDILALLIRKFRARVLPHEQEEQAHRDEINLFMDPAFACSSLSRPETKAASNAPHATGSPIGGSGGNPGFVTTPSGNSTARSAFTPPPNQSTIPTVRGRRSSSDVTQSVSSRVVDLFGLDQDEDELKSGSPQLRQQVGEKNGTSSAFLQSRITSQEKTIAMLQEKLSSLSVLLKSIDHEKKQIQSSLEVKDKRIELQQMKIKQLEKLTAQYNSQSHELQSLRAKLDDEEQLRITTQKQLEAAIAAAESPQQQNQETQTDDPKEKDAMKKEGWFGEDIASQLSPRSINFEMDYMAQTVERLQRQVEDQQRELTALQDQHLAVVAERNAFKSKTNELGKELRKLVNATRSLADIESQLAERSQLAMQLAVSKAEAKRASDESKEYKDALECVMKQQGMGNKDKDTQRVLSQNLDLQRVVRQLTDSLNESKEQMAAMKSINSALMEKLQHLQPDARGSILFESPMNSPSSVASARINPTFSSDEEDDDEDDDEEEKDH